MHDYGYTKALPQLIIAVASSVLADLILCYLVKKKIKKLGSPIITGLILAIVLAPNASLIKVAMLSVMAIASKYLIKINGHHVLNPAVLALAVNVFTFGIPLAWWAAEYITWSIVLGAILLISLRIKTSLFRYLENC